MAEELGGRPPTRRLALDTTEPTSVGYGFISGLFSAMLGISAFGAVLCLHFPQYLTHPQLRPLYSLVTLRPAIQIVMMASLVLGTASAILRTNKMLAVIGIAFTLAASLLGGSEVRVEGAMSESSWLGLDFFVLNLIVYSAIFIPLERLFALRPAQAIFRRHWVIDLTYFFINSLLIEILTILTLKPAVVFFGWAKTSAVTNAVSSVPLVVQVPALLLVADFTQYWVHRAFHAVPFLWPFHAIHHSIEDMDWLAGSRLHLVDVVLTRGLTYLPIFILGFPERALMVYVFIVAAQATFIHANVSWEFRPLRRVVATPAFHHWHHSAAAEAIDKNFAVHTPIWDVLFGTYYLPKRWPETYGLAGGRRVPPRWLTQLVDPFRHVYRRRL